MRVREEQRMMDRKIIAEIDQKVIDQQNTLEKAGVPGFFITTNPQVASVVFFLSNELMRKERKRTFTLASCLLGADDADEPAGTDPEASAKGVTGLNSLGTLGHVMKYGVRETLMRLNVDVFQLTMSGQAEGNGFFLLIIRRAGHGCCVKQLTRGLQLGDSVQK